MVMKNRLVIILIAVLLGGCASSGSSYSEKSIPKEELLLNLNYKAAESLISKSGTSLDKTIPLVIATIVNIDNLESSSTLGRTISEQVSSKFTQAGYSMVEMKFHNAVYMQQNEGEMVLTREIREIAHSHQAQAVIVGTYSKADKNVYVNLKIVQPDRGRVISACDYIIPRSPDVNIMIKSRESYNNNGGYNFYK